VGKKKKVIKASQTAPAARALLRLTVGIVVLLAGIAAWNTATIHSPNDTPIVDGYNFMPYFKGEVPAGPRREFFYFSNTADLMAMRYDEWKVSFKTI